jgi:hypothetical protein
LKGRLGEWFKVQGSWFKVQAGTRQKAKNKRQMTKMDLINTIKVE